VTRLLHLSYPTAILRFHVVYFVFSDEAVATALYADIHALDYAVLTSSKQTSPISGEVLLSFIQHC
jgi:hypothetical protein